MAPKVRTALIITPAFFGYEQEIAAEFDRQGWQVVVLDERPSNRAFMRAVFRVRPSTAALRTQHYYRQALARLGEATLDLVLVVKGEVVPEWFLEALRQRSPDARVVGYSYDSIANSRRFAQLLRHFDVAYSFDRSDAETVGIDYLPLFYSPPFEAVDDRPRKRDLAFVGTLHSDRFHMVSELSRGYSTYTYFFVQARWYFAVLKHVTRSARGVAWSDVRFRTLSLPEVASLFGSSRCVIDIQRTGQTGLTMRTFEALASGAVLLTSNAAIVDEPFYDPARVVVFSEGDLASCRTMIERALADRVDDPTWVTRHLRDYSLASWVRTVCTPATRPGMGEVSTT